MGRLDQTFNKLENVSRKLQERGASDLAQEIEEAIDELRQRRVPEPPGGVMTTGEAAAALGVRSINTIKHWVGAGLLDGFRRGGRILVSRQSVKRMAGCPTVALQQNLEAGLTADLAPFDFGDVDEEEISRTPWAGHKPWIGSENAKR